MRSRLKKKNRRKIEAVLKNIFEREKKNPLEPRMVFVYSGAHRERFV